MRFSSEVLCSADKCCKTRLSGGCACTCYNCGLLASDMFHSNSFNVRPHSTERFLLCIAVCSLSEGVCRRGSKKIHLIHLCGLWSLAGRCDDRGINITVEILLRDLLRFVIMRWNEETLQRFWNLVDVLYTFATKVN